MAKCWYTVMELRIQQLRSKFPDVPIAIAGDLFDRPDPPSSLVSWAISTLEGMRIYAIPGQHDLPFHRYNARHEGAYGALVKAGTIKDLPAGEWTMIGNMEHAVAIYSMPWEKYTVPDDPPPDGMFRLGLLHKYVWTDASNCYIGAEQDSNAVCLAKYMPYFDLIAVGDNHIAWRTPKILNHGSLFSTTSAQIGHVPYVGVLYDNNTFEVVPFPEIDVEWQPGARQEKVDSVLASLSAMEVATVGFRETLASYVEQSDGQAKILYQDLYDYLVQ